MRPGLAAARRAWRRGGAGADRAAGAAAHGHDLHQPGPRRHRDPPGGRRRGPDAAQPRPPRPQPAHDRDRGVSHVHADGGADARAAEGSAGNDEINVNSVEGQPLSLDVSMSFELDPTRVPALYSTFRTDIATIQHTYVKQAIRQSLQEVVGNEEIAAIIGPEEGGDRGPGDQAAGAAALGLRDHGEAVHHQRAAGAARR